MTTIVQNKSWDVIDQWIVANDNNAQHINHVIRNLFKSLNDEDHKLLSEGLIRIINFIRIKFGFIGRETIFWEQLIQNESLDLKALLANMLPFIHADEDNSKKSKLEKLSNLYTEVDKLDRYIYTNCQYNRCVRHFQEGKISAYERPYLKEYFLQHLELLLMSIDAVSNKLYVNWVDVIPYKINDYSDTKLYQDTVGKINKSDVQLINNYIDPNPGLGYQDIYNVISNHLYHQIKNYKWIIYDVVVNQKPVSYIKYLETQISFKSIWDEIVWIDLKDNERNTFSNEWHSFLRSMDNVNNGIIYDFHYFFSKYYKDAKKLVLQKKLILPVALRPEDDQEDEEDILIGSDMVTLAKRALANVPTEDIYTFLYIQLTAFQKTWYYYQYRKNQYIANSDNMYVTLKNIYNYCESMVHSTVAGKYLQLPRLWLSLKPESINLVLIRLMDITDPQHNDWTKDNWFNINRYIKRIYPKLSDDLQNANHELHTLIRPKMIEIVFESLIYQGILSHFNPNKAITDDSITKNKPTKYKTEQMRSQYFSGKNKGEYEKNAYYFINGKPYGKLEPKYFDFLTSGQTWMFTYAMNWVNQINLYHHYINNRVIYITGSTGVGKSTQMPKLLMYGQKMLDYNFRGKIVCTQPRIPPTMANAETISRELGVPIRAEDNFTSNYYVQFKHSMEEHTNRSVETFLKIVTDGTLFEEIRNYPFLTYAIPDQHAVDHKNSPINWVKKFTATNVYDIVIVDEAHEHNVNMDMILTLARDSIYINNSVKLVIISATMEDDDPIYRRYYRTINDNRAYPLNAYIENQTFDRANVDRRIHISPPGATTLHKIDDIYLPKTESDKINDTNFVEFAISKTIEVANTTYNGDLLLFLTGRADIDKAVKQINAKTPANTITFGFYSELTKERREFIEKIHQTLKTYTRYKEDIDLEEKDVARRVPAGTYTRAIIIATNVAEASITLETLRYVIDSGYAKVNVFDPIEGISKLVTLPISKSSSLQRRGRVGRVAPGTVYYLYDKEKIENNKTEYKIANEDIKDMVIKLLKSDPNDYPIIHFPNDINSVQNLKELRKPKPADYPYQYLVYLTLINPTPYIDIIKQKYLYIPNLEDISQYYIYYGKTDHEDYNTEELNRNFKEYILNNHDDYHYQETVLFQSRGYTGYESAILNDQLLSFYLIHPDENVIYRNLYTGAATSFKYHPAVTNGYYFSLLRANGVGFQNEEEDFKLISKKINRRTIVLLKYPLAIRDARLQLLVIDIPIETISPVIKYTDKPNVINNVIRRYFNYQPILYLENNSGDIVVKSVIASKLETITSVASLSVLRNTNNVMWYAYSIPYNLQNDVLAIITLMAIAPRLNSFLDDITSKYNVRSFYDLHIDQKGDIHFLWKLWEEIKTLLVQNKVLDLTNMEYYMSDTQPPKIKTRRSDDNTYNYYLELTKDFDQILKKDIFDYLDIIAKRNKVSPEKLRDFATLYLNSLFESNRKLWLYNYEIDHQIRDVDPKDNVINWAKESFNFPRAIIGKYDDLDPKWNYILETYIRAFSTNLIKNEGKYYVKVNNGLKINLAFWSDKIEETMLYNKPEYIIYQSYMPIRGEIVSRYLTPVKIEWVFNSNPIYYYFYLFRETGSNNDINFISKEKNLFDPGQIISYLNQINEPTITDIITKTVGYQKN